MIETSRRIPILPLWVAGVPIIILTTLFVDRPFTAALFAHEVPTHFFSWIKGCLNLPPSAASSFHGWVAVLDIFPVLTALAPVLMLGAIFVRNERFHDLLLLTGASVLSAYVLKNDLKWAFHRDWPFLWSPDHSTWFLNPENGFHLFAGKFASAGDGIGSFPSGHASILFALLVPVMLAFPPMRPWCLLTAGGFCGVLVLIGVHYPGDVLAGALLGTTCALALRDLLWMGREAGGMAGGGSSGAGN